MEIITTLDNIKSTAHTHSNKSILDNTTASFTTALKTKLDGIEAGANKTTVDTALSSTSTNPVQNKVVTSALNTIPTKTSDLTNDSGFTTNKGTVTSVAVKMNGTTKGTVTSSGTIDLGTVITSLPNHPDYDNEGMWYNGEILVATSQFGIGNSGIDINSVVTTSDTATSSTYGLVKLGNSTVQSTAANSVTSTSSRTYAIQKNSNGQLVVNVPWAGANMKISFYGYVNVGSSTDTSFTKYSSNSLSGGTYGRVYNIFAKSKGSGGGISVQKKATYYTDYDCVAQATANSSF